ncbi:MAG TPA: SCO6880 family protein, partial [Acidimicrobiales bacterium]|nr:SCO6880 family protein [Acidimicrobiales bacterium]
MSAPGGSQYRFGPRERGGALAGWRAGQILTVAVGLVFGVLVLRWAPDALGVAAAVAILVLYGALATVPVAGRTGDEWLPVVVFWSARRARPCAAGRTQMGALRGVRLLRAGWHDMGVVHDRSARTLTAALSLRGGSFALLGADEQDRRVGAWSAVLASLAREGSPVHRVQWVAASFPDDGRDVRSYLATEAVPDVGSACAASYEALLHDMDAHACAHDVVLAVQVRLARSVETGCATLAREV